MKQLKYTEYQGLRLEPKMKKELEKVAKKRKQDISTLIRQCIDHGLSVILKKNI